VLVGIATFGDPAIHSLSFTLHDVKALAELLRESGSFEEIVPLLEELATRDRILRTIDDVVRQIAPGDLLFLYFATHGVRIGDTSCLVTWDTIADRLRESDAIYITMSELLARLPPLHTFLIVTDSCHQGSPLPDSGFSLPASLPYNIAGFQSSLADEKSIENGQLQHGVFSYYLLQALRGEADRGRNNAVTVFDLHTYVTGKVRDYTHGRQNPVLTYRGGDDFVVCTHPPTDAQLASKARADKKALLLEAMTAFWRVEAWTDVLDKWDELLHLTYENDRVGVQTAIEARKRLDAAMPPAFERDARSSLRALSDHPRVWPCLRDGGAIHLEARQTHPDAVHGDLLLGIELIEGKIAVVSGIYLAKTTAFRAAATASEAETDRAATRDISHDGRIAYYVLAEKQIDLHEKSVDLEDFKDLPWHDLVNGARPLQSLTRDLRAMGAWTAIRTRILKRHPREATQLFELELQPLQHMASGSAGTQLRDADLQALREIGSDLIKTYLSPINGAERGRRNRTLKSVLESALNPELTETDVERPSRTRARQGRITKTETIPEVPPEAESEPAPLLPASARLDGPGHSAGVLPESRDDPPDATRDTAVMRPGSVTGPLPQPPPTSTAHGVAPVSTTHRAAPDLRLTVRGGMRTLRSGDVVLWRSTGSAFDWTQPQFSDAGDPSQRLDLAAVKHRLPDWDRDRTLRFGAELSALLLGPEIPSEVIAALTVDAGDRRRLVLELDSTAAEAPWEYLHLNTGFILERRLSIVRHVDASGTNRVHPLILEPPPRVLVFAEADPFGKGLEIQAHRLQIERALTGTIAVHPIGSCTPDRLQDALVGRHVDGFHFLGHGERDHENVPCLVVHADVPSQRSTRLYPHALTRWLGASQARFVFLGACHSGDTAPGFSGIAEAIVRTCGIPVVAMQLAVPQQFSTSFAARFYDQLRSCGFDLERAVHQARQFEYADRHAFGIPVLFADVMKQPRAVPELAVPPGGPWAKFAVTVALHAPPPPDPVRVPVPGPLLVPEPAPVLEPAPTSEPARISVPAAASEPAPLPRSGDATVVTIGDVALQIDWNEARRSFTELRRRYALADDLLPRIAAELDAGRHVVLTGPVGTGKTSIAREVVQALGYTPYVVTASAEWTSFEVVGGFFPHALKDSAGHRIDYAFRPGVFVEAVRANWEERGGTDRSHVWHRRRSDVVRGTWLVLDEINRADIDRALGGVFTALERLWLRIPVASTEAGSTATVEIPIPRDFRIVASMNAVDRHYLFRLSDALKRRFAFIDVPVSEQLSDEWQKIWQWCELQPGDLPADEARLHDALRRFTYLVRAFHPVGTAQLLAAVRFLIKSRPAGLTDEVRLHQALAGSILPGLEEAPRELLRLLRKWAESRDSLVLFEALRQAPALYRTPAGSDDHEPRLISQRFRRMLAQLEQIARGDLPTEVRMPLRADDAEDSLLRTFAQLATRQHEPDRLLLLHEHLSEMARS
jgi:MoxR-like ATPase